MKSIFAMTFLITSLAVISLSCKNAGNTFATSNTPQANSSAGETPLSSPQPTAADKDKILSEVVAAEREFIAANVRGDKAAIDRLISDDFSARYGGQIYDKDSWIGSPKGFSNIAGDDVLKPELIGYTADTATLHFEERTTYNDNTATNVKVVSTSFVKKDGRWLIKSTIIGH
jgi:hypothetical protein